MSETIKIDVAIIGAGSAGLSARRVVVAQRMSALMIDPGPYGTTCARVGCMPSKLLIAAADAAHEVQKASMFGVHAGEVQIDGKAVMARVKFERDRFVGFVNESIDDHIEQGNLLSGRATIVEQNKLSVEKADGSKVIVEFERLVLAVGGRPITPPPFRHIIEPVLITNEQIFDLEDLPESMLVIGLGVIGIELGQAMSRLGVRTTLLGVGGTIGPIHDPEILEEAKMVFKKELDLHPNYELKSISMLDNNAGVEIHFVDSDGNERTETYAKVLMAAGRRPNMDLLGLENIGVQRDANGEWGINKGTLQLRDLPIYIAGDANNFHPLLHEATDDGRLAGENAVRHPEALAPSRRTKIAVMFSDPQIAIIGHNDRQFHGMDLAEGKVTYSNQGRARVMGVNQGIFKIYGEYHTGRIVGGEFFGPRAENMAHLLAWAIQAGLTVDDALSMPFYHPVLEEGLRTALRDLSSQINQRATVKCHVAEFGVGS